MKNKAYTLVALLIALVLIDLGLAQLAPQFAISNPVLGINTSYRMSFYSTNNLTTSTQFTVNFNQSNIRVVDGVNACNIRIGGVLVSAPQCSCINRVCTFRPMSASDPRTVEI
jgi:hypothetical protein